MKRSKVADGLSEEANRVGLELAQVVACNRHRIAPATGVREGDHFVISLPMHPQGPGEPGDYAQGIRTSL